MNHSFNVGDLVQRRNQPELIGVVREHRWDEQTESWNYLIQFGAQLLALPEEALEPIRHIETPWDALREGRLSGLRYFIFTLTFHRLHTPPARMAYAFSTARTQFYPHQFKPLLKFFDNQRNGLLIADDVGLGKTIEAGYILRELQARQAGVDRILIVVPARLAPKWKREMKLRFEEHFDIIKGDDLVRVAERLRQGRELEPFNWIISYESVRPEYVRRALEETQPSINLLIADEAHRMRNPESLQHKVGATLSRCSDNTLFLTATPVQNKLEDLWNLLRLLSPEEFPLWPLFQNQVDANRLILAAQHALTKEPPEVSQSHAFLERFSTHASTVPLSGEFLSSIVARLVGTQLERKELVELHADIGQLSLLGHLISRTRKGEAMPNRALRSAMWSPVILTAPERHVYERVEELCQLAWPTLEDSWGFRMAVLMAYRATASSIPAAMKYFSDKLNQAKSSSDLAAQFESENDGSLSTTLNVWNGPSRPFLEEIVAQWEASGKVDTKLDSLVEAIERIWKEDDTARRSRRKIVLFSYFRRTLEYLNTTLSARGFNLRTIHGGISVDEREFVIDEFLERKDVPLLLTSEVGGEGIDLQRASVLFNYDLPWNPMVVEQRIGRLDRIGQQAKRIVIVNFIVKDSIEEHVLQRLLEKVEIFRESIGEMDPIIGDEIERLTEKALSGELSSNEMKRAVEESGKALQLRVREARTMLSRVDNLLAADQNLVDEINAVTGERQIPSESELLLFLNMFLERNFAGCQLPSQAANRVVKVDLRGPLGPRIEAVASEIGPDAIPFARKIMSGALELTVSREAGYRHPRAEMFHLRHPLVKFAVNEISKEGKKTAFALKLTKDCVLPPGLYAFLVSLVELRGHTNSMRLAPVFVHVKKGTVWNDPDETTPVVLQMMESGQDAEIGNISLNDMENAKSRLLSGLDSIKADWQQQEKRLEQMRREQRQAIMHGVLRLRLQRANQRLRTLQERDAAEFPIRMAQAQVEKAEQEFAYSSKLDGKNVESGIGAVVEAAVGFVQIGG